MEAGFPFLEVEDSAYITDRDVQFSHSVLKKKCIVLLKQDIWKKERVLGTVWPRRRTSEEEWRRTSGIYRTIDSCHQSHIYQISHVRFVDICGPVYSLLLVGKLLRCCIYGAFVHNQPFPLRCSVPSSLIGSSLLIVSKSERCYSPADDFTTPPFITALLLMWYITTTGLHTCCHVWWNTSAAHEQWGFYSFPTALIVINQAAPSWLLNAIPFLFFLPCRSNM